MLVREWDDFIERCPRPHLVCGVNVMDEKTDRTPLLLRLLAVLDVGEDYAITAVEDRGLWCIQVGFESEADAKRLASAVLAKPKERFVGFETQREFWFDSVVAAKIARALRS
jgi:hypothetical protein